MFLLFFLDRSNYKIREIISGQCWLAVCDAGLTLAERLVYVLGRDTIRNIMRGLDKAYRLSSESHHCLTLTLAQHCSNPVTWVIAKHSQHEALNQCWFSAVQTSATMAQCLRTVAGANACDWMKLTSDLRGDMTGEGGKCFLRTKKQKAINHMLGLKLDKRRKQWPNIKMCLVSCRPTCITAPIGGPASKRH